MRRSGWDRTGRGGRVGPKIWHGVGVAVEDVIGRWVWF